MKFFFKLSGSYTIPLSPNRPPTPKRDILFLSTYIFDIRMFVQHNFLSDQILNELFESTASLILMQKSKTI